jgi:hypothetical protein
MYKNSEVIKLCIELREGQVQWFMPVIPDTLEAAMGRIQFEASLGKNL